MIIEVLQNETQIRLNCIVITCMIKVCSCALNQDTANDNFDTAAVSVGTYLQIVGGFTTVIRAADT
jgi:hypothetical protein